MIEINVKPVHLKNDSNPSRQKRNEERKLELKDQFLKTNLMNIPEHFHMRNEKVYEVLVNNLRDLGLGFHLKDADLFSLVAVANTMDLINETERNLHKYGSYQTIETREGYEKIVETPFVRMRSTNLNLLQSQLKQLQIDPQSRQLLTESVLGVTSMIVNDEKDDNKLLQGILGRLEE